MGGREKREFTRKPLRMELNYRESGAGSFLYEYSTNISRGGLFIATEQPADLGTALVVRFTAPSGEDLEIEGTVAWVNPVVDGDENPNPGMGIQWGELSDDQRELIASIVKAIAIVE